MKTFTRPISLTSAFFLLFFIVSGCVNTGKLINSGNYDVAIDKSLKKLRKNKSKEKHIVYLKRAFVQANQRDMNRINFLKQEGQPDNSVEIYSTYDQIKRRQEKIRPVLPLYLNGKEVNFAFLDVDAEIIAWKQQAAGFLYSNALKLLESGDKLDARKAYYQLNQIKGLYQNYKDVDEQIKIAYNKGMNWVFFDVDNNSLNIVPKEFNYELFSMNFTDMESQWTKIVPNNGQKSNIQFDYTIVVNIKQVDIGPEAWKEVRYEETKEIEDGWQYLKDEKGNVKKDSLGNDIKVPKYKQISCEVIETRQTKVADFRGSVDFYDDRQNKKVMSEPFATAFVFEHFSAVANGNKDALKPETQKKLGNRPIPFPSNFQMVMDGSQEIKKMVHSIVKRKKYMLES